MPPTKGGVTTFMLNLMASPLAAEVEFIAFTTSRPPKRNVTANWGYRAVLRGGLRRIVHGLLVTLWHLALFPFALRRAEMTQIQASDYQVFWEAGLYALIARVMRRPVLFRIGGAFDLFYDGASRVERRLIAAVLRLPTIVIAQSEFGRDVIRAAGRDGRIILLPNWSHLPDALSRRPATPTCLFIAGQEAIRKGVAEVFAAAVLLRDAPVRIHMLAATPSLCAQAAALGLPGLSIEGPVSHEAVLEAMQRCDIFLLPSHGEGFPNSLIEAMAAGMACIATPAGAVPEIAADGGIMLTPAGDAAALAAVICRLAGSVELRKALGERARDTVARRYTAAAALPELAAAYRGLAGGGAARR